MHTTSRMGCCRSSKPAEQEDCSCSEVSSVFFYILRSGPPEVALPTHPGRHWGLTSCCWASVQIFVIDRLHPVCQPASPFHFIFPMVYMQCLHLSLDLWRPSRTTISSSFQNLDCVLKTPFLSPLIIQPTVARSLSHHSTDVQLDPITNDFLSKWFKTQLTLPLYQLLPT